MKMLARLTRNWASQKSRTDRRIMNNLGTIKGKLPKGASKMYRKTELHIMDMYFDSKQYDHLLPWESAQNIDGSYVPLHERRPKIVAPFTKMLCQRVGSRLVGDDVFPKLTIEGDPDTSEYIRMVMKSAKLKSRLVQPICRLLNNGSVFVRFYIDEQSFVLEHYEAKYCYPKLAPNGELSSMRIRYVYEDMDDKDDKGSPKSKWYQIDLGPQQDILYDNPLFEEEKEPVFQVKETADHNMGFVQGEWFRTAELRDNVDGYPIVEGILDFVDSLNYSISQSDGAVQYNQDPQLFFKGMDQDEMDSLVRSATKSWNLGRDGEAGFLESNLNGVQVALEFRDKMRLNVMDFARVILMDPEKMASHAQSGRALEILHGPMVELVKELRPIIGENIKNLVLKMAIANLIMANSGAPSPIMVPPGYKPMSLDLALSWPPVFPMTIEDIQKKVQVASQAASGFLISEETATAWVAKDFGIEDIEEERAKIAAQPVRNPFGGF